MLEPRRQKEITLSDCGERATLLHMRRSPALDPSCRRKVVSSVYRVDSDISLPTSDSRGRSHVSAARPQGERQRPGPARVLLGLTSDQQDK